MCFFNYRFKSTMNEKISKFLPAMKVHLCWTVKFLIVTTMCNNLPFDVSGQLNTTFHSGVTFGLGFVLLVITGRDLGIIKRTCRKISRIITFIYIPCLSFFVVWYIGIFNFSGMFSHSGALQNKPVEATLCSVTFAFEVFVISYSISVRNDQSKKTE